MEIGFWTHVLCGIGSFLLLCRGLIALIDIIITWHQNLKYIIFHPDHYGILNYHTTGLGCVRNSILRLQMLDARFIAMNLNCNRVLFRRGYRLCRLLTDISTLYGTDIQIYIKRVYLCRYVTVTANYLESAEYRQIVRKICR